MELEKNMHSERKWDTKEQDGMSQKSDRRAEKSNKLFKMLLHQQTEENQWSSLKDFLWAYNEILNVILNVLWIQDRV